jgi:glycosyltransferase involved in cell wall biosynthesis
MANAALSARPEAVRVVSVLHSIRPDFSGEGESWLRMARPLRDRGVEVEILTSCPRSSAAPERERLDGVLVQRVHVDGPRPYWTRMRGVLGTLARRRGQFDIALFHSPSHDMVYPGCLLGRLLGWKTVYKLTLLGYDDLVAIRRTGKYGAVRLAALRWADGYISVSEALGRTFAQVGFHPRRMVTIPEGVDTERFRPPLDSEKRAVRLRLGIPDQARVVLFCGSIMRRKGVDILAEAWRRVSVLRNDAVLLLLGSNHRDGLVGALHEPFSRSIERRLWDLLAAGSVRLLGYRQDVEPFYAAADVFVLPSRAEGWASAVNEAMASGLPCVVSSVAAEQVRDGEDGFVLSTEDPATYAERLLRLMDDPAAAKSMGQRARRRVVEHRDATLTADRLAIFLRSIHQQGDEKRGKPVSQTGAPAPRRFSSPI